MLLSWIRHRRRERLLAQAFPEAWASILAALPFYRGLDDDERRKLRDILRVLVAEKRWEGCGGFEVTTEVKVIIAAQAARLVLNLEHDYYRAVESILVYPSTYVTPWGHADRAGIVEKGRPRSGEAWLRGPVILAWDSVTEGLSPSGNAYNVVLHEFSHKLDMLDGFADGTPPLRNRAAYAAWKRIMTEEFERLTDHIACGRVTVLDEYGATNRAEFFAVATECFFERPGELRAQHAHLYELLRDYYHQDPAKRRRG